MAVVGVSTIATNYTQSDPVSATELTQTSGRALRIIAPGAATYQLKKSESGALCLFSEVAVAYTLPEIKDATDLGMSFEFAVTTTTTSAHSVTTKVATEFLVGVILGISDVVTAEDAFTANGTSHVTMSMSSTTTGGIAGGVFRFTAVTLTQWMVDGITMGSGTLATPFS
ncbi:MAG: hypothetical protein WC465_04900 [Patescibacteria group bacterium]